MLAEKPAWIIRRISPDPVLDRRPTYVLKTTLISVATALTVVHVVGFVWLEWLEWPPGASSADRHNGVWTWLSAVVWGPIGESLFLYLACAFAFINARERPVAASVVIGIVAGLLHGIFAPLWFFGPAVSFGIWSFAWFRWRTVHPPRGFLILLVPHMLQNLLAMVLVAA
ncbi:hypothetical protein [Roseateles terrae]|uniref:CPBP family intramembrane metalloprotease n=1 Tax=Roseateles terrae TaxID=431060 RepID=A0ABR6GPP6_9BURK|nr:hypothetical protein [Roseateles terrae]MBB3193153.1 hypothetical protein [Roseateles terrae]OWQ89625.1 hypothetical protein CDN98_03630 [Roseateles terrae]